MRRFLAVVAAVCLGLAVAGTLPAGATDADTLNQQVSGSLSYMDGVNMRLCPPGTPPFYEEMPYQTSSGGTGLLRLGLCQLNYRSTRIIDQNTTLYTYDAVGSFEIVTPGGDTVRGDVSGEYTQQTGVGKSVYTLDVSMTKRFGTGQFEGATGTIQTAGTFFYGGRVDGHPGTINGNVTGSLTPASK